jgi:hypothetical protein
MPTLVTSDATSTIVIKAGGRKVESVTDADLMITTESN